MYVVGWSCWYPVMETVAVERLAHCEDLYIRVAEIFHSLEWRWIRCWEGCWGGGCHVVLYFTKVIWYEWSKNNGQLLEETLGGGWKWSGVPRTEQEVQYWASFAFGPNEIMKSWVRKNARPSERNTDVLWSFRVRNMRQFVILQKQVTIGKLYLTPYALLLVRIRG